MVNILLDLKNKRLSNLNYTKILQPNRQNPCRVWVSFFLPDFISNTLSADHQNERISICMEYSSSPSDALHRSIPILYIFGFFQIGNLSFIKSPSLTHVKKRCQQSAKVDWEGSLSLILVINIEIY